MATLRSWRDLLAWEYSRLSTLLAARAPANRTEDRRQYLQARDLHALRTFVFGVELRDESRPRSRKEIPSAAPDRLDRTPDGSSYLGCKIIIALFSLYAALFSHLRPRDVTPENCFFQILSYTGASKSICMHNLWKATRQIPWITSSDLNWENKPYKPKTVYYASLANISNAPFTSDLRRQWTAWSLARKTWQQANDPLGPDAYKAT